jgi:hypothetical protein
MRLPNLGKIFTRAGRAAARSKGRTRKAGDYFANTRPKPKAKTKTRTTKPKTKQRNKQSKSTGGLLPTAGKYLLRHPLQTAVLGGYGYSTASDIGRGINQDLLDQVVGAGGELEKGLPTQIMQGLGFVQSDEQIKKRRVAELERDLAPQIALIEKHGGTAPELTFDMTARQAAGELSVPFYDAQKLQQTEDYETDPQVIEARAERERQNRLEEQALRRETARENFLMDEQVIQRMQDNRRQRNDSLAGLAAVFAALAAG